MHRLAPVAVFAAWPLLVVPGTGDPFHAAKLVALAAIVAGTGFGAMISAVRSRAARTPTPAFLAVAGAWVAWAACTISWSPVPWDGWLRVSTEGLSVAAAFVLIPFIPREDRRAPLLVLAVGGALLAVWGLGQYAGWEIPLIPGAEYPDWRHRITATLGNPNLLANWLACILPPTAALALTARTAWGRFAAAVMLTAQTAALAVTFTLGALGALVVGLCVGVLVHRRTLVSCMGRVTPAVAGLVICCLVLPVLYFFVSHPARPVSIPQQAFASPAFRNGMRNRVLIWRSSARMAAEAWPLGVGAGGFARAYPWYRGRVFLETEETHEPAVLDGQSHRFAHNELLHEVAETGAPGAILLLAALVTALAGPGTRRTRGLDPAEAFLRAAAWTGALAGILHSMVSFPFRIVPNSAAAWLLLVLAWTPPPARDRRRAPHAGAFVVTSLVCMGALASLGFLARDYAEQVALFRLSEANRGGRREEALHTALRAANLRPDSEALRYLAGWYAAQKRYGDADACYQRLIGRFDEIGLRTDRARVLRARGELREASSQWDHALALDPCWEPLRLEAIRAALNAGLIERARALLAWFDDHPPSEEAEVASLRDRADRARNAW